jgi:signal transduction histidine kinase
VPVVEWAAPEMVRVIRNLLDNAIRHTAPGGTITVSTSLDRGGGAVRVAVRDGCGGIPERDLPQVFDMGYQGDAARTPGDHRGGLGLAVARGLVEAHQGDITVRNVGPGCEFTVLLPLRTRRTAPVARMAEPSPTHAT